MEVLVLVTDCVRQDQIQSSRQGGRLCTVVQRWTWWMWKADTDAWERPVSALREMRRRNLVKWRRKDIEAHEEVGEEVQHKDWGRAQKRDQDQAEQRGNHP